MTLTNLEITLEDVQRELLLRRRNKLKHWFPDTGPNARSFYPKHMEVIAATAHHRQVCMMAANRVGKSELGAFIVATHLTGRYPDWWTGKKFDKPINCMVAGETGMLVRDSVQIKLMGEISDLGTGMIPFDCIIGKSRRAGIPDAFDTVTVKHISGGISSCSFHSYDQGREKYQATARHLIWDDEEPPLAIYSEQIIRTMTTNGILLSTFTPLKGVSETVLSLREQARDGNVTIITATWDDAHHLSESAKEELFKALPPHQRDARSKGVPALGSGAIYPVREEDIICDDIEIPKHWKRCYGLDVGWNRTAAIWLALDPETDVAYAYSEHYQGNEKPIIHAAAIKGRGDWIPGVIDPAANGRAQADGEQLMQQYRELGLDIENANNAVEAGIYQVWQRLSTGKLKIFKSLNNLRGEYRLYRRDDKGKIVKENDHALDAVRYAIMSGLDRACVNIAKQTFAPQHNNDPLAWMAN